MNSRSASSAPASLVRLSPAPTAPRGFVVRSQSAAIPPVARITARAEIHCLPPSSALTVTPLQRPSLTASAVAATGSSKRTRSFVAACAQSARVIRRPVAAPPAWAMRRAEWPPPSPARGPSPPFFRHPASLDHDTGHGHPERPDRIRAVEGELKGREWLGWEPVEAPRATEEQLLRVHHAEYVERVRAMSERGAAFDMDTPTSPGSYEAALRSAGGACALAEALLGGGEHTGFSALRPPGHHAETETAMGFCLFANVAVAAPHPLA